MTSRLLTASVAAVGIAMLSGCMTSDDLMESSFADAGGLETFGPQESISMIEDDSSFGAPPLPGYEAMVDDGFSLAAIPTSKIDPQFLRQQVAYDAGDYEPGTVVVDTPNRFLYVIEAGGMAMRYGIGVGGAGFSWAGEARIGAKKHWPKWHPPKEMIERKPELAEFANGMEPGLLNPLGARALYLHQDGRDTLYRLHGTPEWWSIGTAASSGCIRLTNQDIIDLYERVPEGARVVVVQGNERLAGQSAEPQVMAQGSQGVIAAPQDIIEGQQGMIEGQQDIIETQQDVFAQPQDIIAQTVF